MAAIFAPQTPPPELTANDAGLRPVDVKYDAMSPAFDTASLASDTENSSPCSSPSPRQRRYAFTPHRVVRVPRAWERKPSTPFAPRIEGQRIWKRVPLGERQGQFDLGSRRSKDVVKVVKKLKMEGELEEQGIRLSVETCVEGLEEGRRKVSSTTSMAQDEKEPQQFEKPSDSVAQPAEAPADDLEDDLTSSSTHDIDTQLSPAASTVQGEFQEPAVSGEELQHHHQLAEDADFTLETSTDETEPGPPEEQVTTALGQDPNLPVNDQLLLANPTEQEEDVPIETMTTATPTSPSTDIPTEATPAEAAPQTTGRRRSSLGAIFTGHGIVHLPEPSESEPEPESTTTGKSAAQASSPNDDTAFLHAFLTRTRAQKAARAQSSPEKKTVSEQMATERPSASDVKLPSSPSPAFDLPAPTESEPDASEATADSPCRRSARTRLPRPQKVTPAVPSNIPVRRSNGTEFIFLQRTEAQEIALATRVNTRRNKGDAVHPRYKLQYINDPNVGRSPVKSSPKKRKTRKEVSWHERLTEVHEAELAEEGDGPVQPAVAETTPSESKPAVKKRKKLGTVNGTPAPKRTVDAVMTEAAVPERRLRSRTKR